jgi:hypothetical protein
MKKTTFVLVALLSFGLLAQALVGCGGRTRVVSSDGKAEDDKIDLVQKKKAQPGTAKAKGEKRRNSEDTGAGDADPSGAGFVLPTDEGGKILAGQLPPHQNVPPPPGGVSTRPRRVPAGLDFETPDLPLPPSQAEMPQPPLDRNDHPVRPRAVGGDPPLTWNRGDPKAPAPKKLPEARRTRQPSLAVDEPLPLPVLGQAVPDRAPLTDPTADISRMAAVAGSAPLRTTPIPFLRLNLPDPFEHQKVIRLRKAPPEKALPKNAGSQPPGKSGK